MMIPRKRATRVANSYRLGHFLMGEACFQHPNNTETTWKKSKIISNLLIEYFQSLNLWLFASFCAFFPCTHLFFSSLPVGQDACALINMSRNWICWDVKTYCFPDWFNGQFARTPNPPDALIANRHSDRTVPIKVTSYYSFHTFSIYLLRGMLVNVYITMENHNF